MVLLRFYIARIGLVIDDMSTFHLHSPLRSEEITQLKIGDLVYFSGSAFTCRSKLFEYVFDHGKPLPFQTREKNLLVHAGPVVRKRKGKWKLISFTPTSSIRFEKWGAKSVRNLGLKAIVGKTTMRSSTMTAMKDEHCIHATVQSVCPNLWLDSIEIEGVYLLKELGSIEAPWQLQLNRLGPFLVDIDSHGNSYFRSIQNEVNSKKNDAYRALGIPEEFQYTRLY